VERLNLKKLTEVEDGNSCEIKSRNRLAAVENLDDSEPSAPAVSLFGRSAAALTSHYLPLFSLSMSGFRLVVGWRKLVWGGRAHPRVYLAVTLRYLKKVVYTTVE
jgi:hypothetical protein